MFLSFSLLEFFVLLWTRSVISAFFLHTSLNFMFCPLDLTDRAHWGCSHLGNCFFCLFLVFNIILFEYGHSFEAEKNHFHRRKVLPLCKFGEYTPGLSMSYSFDIYYIIFFLNASANLLKNFHKRLFIVQLSFVPPSFWNRCCYRSWLLWSGYNGQMSDSFLAAWFIHLISTIETLFCCNAPCTARDVLATCFFLNSSIVSFWSFAGVWKDPRLPLSLFSHLCRLWRYFAGRW